MGKRARVLVVDDDEAIREHICTNLTLAGYDAFRARDGLEALERIQGLKPEAMVLDLRMPKLDGFEVLATLGPDRVRQTPTLVLTASHNESDVKRVVALGARDYLVKPFEDSTFRMRVERLLQPRMRQMNAQEAMIEMDEMMAESIRLNPDQ